MRLSRTLAAPSASTAYARRARQDHVSPTRGLKKSGLGLADPQSAELQLDGVEGLGSNGGVISPRADA